jgi:hypothetical protein
VEFVEGVDRFRAWQKRDPLDPMTEASQVVFTKQRIIIFGKTYPELSTNHTETVCTGGFREDGTPIRLYPVPLRYLEGDQQYSLYQWITVGIEKNSRDPRPESYKVDAQGLECGAIVDTANAWEARREIVFRDTSWHFANMDALKNAQQSTGRSIGLVKPGEVVDVSVVKKSADEREAFEKKSRDLQLIKESDMFDPEYLKLEFHPARSSSIGDARNGAPPVRRRRTQ